MKFYNYEYAFWISCLSYIIIHTCLVNSLFWKRNASSVENFHLKLWNISNGIILIDVLFLKTKQIKMNCLKNIRQSLMHQKFEKGNKLPLYSLDGLRGWAESILKLSRDGISTKCKSGLTTYNLYFQKKASIKVRCPVACNHE